MALPAGLADGFCANCYRTNAVTSCQRNLEPASRSGTDSGWLLPRRIQVIGTRYGPDDATLYLPAKFTQWEEEARAIKAEIDNHTPVAHVLPEGKRGLVTELLLLEVSYQMVRIPLGIFAIHEKTIQSEAGLARAYEIVSEFRRFRELVRTTSCLKYWLGRLGLELVFGPVLFAVIVPTYRFRHWRAPAPGEPLRRLSDIYTDVHVVPLIDPDPERGPAALRGLTIERWLSDILTKSGDCKHSLIWPWKALLEGLSNPVVSTERLDINWEAFQSWMRTCWFPDYLVSRIDVLSQIIGTRSLDQKRATPSAKALRAWKERGMNQAGLCRGHISPPPGQANEFPPDLDLLWLIDTGLRLDLHVQELLGATYDRRTGSVTRSCSGTKARVLTRLFGRSIAEGATDDFYLAALDRLQDRLAQVDAELGRA